MKTDPPETEKKVAESSDIDAPITPEAFCQNKADVLALREFLASPTGQRFKRVLAGENPLVKLAAPDMHSAPIIRAASKIEGESSKSLLGKSVGYQLAVNLITRRLVQMSVTHQPSSRRSGKRDIQPHAAELP
jgi:hypothetical protein